MNATTPPQDPRPNQNAPQVNEAHPDWIVVDDPRGDWSEGSLVDAPRARQLASRGACLLPVVTGYFRASGAGGYFRRSWGAGYPLNPDHPTMHCPLVVYLDPNSVLANALRPHASTSVVHWRARLAPHGGAKPAGQLRLASDTGQAAAQAASIASGYGKPVDLAQVGAPDARGGWTVGGECQVAAPFRGHYGFGLYGVGRGLRVTWAALSVTLTSR